MSITDELRQYASGYRLNHNMYYMLIGIADHIDAAHESEMAELGWVELPKDACGEHWHIGDESEHGIIDFMTLDEDGWTIVGDDNLYNPETMRHKQPDTWEQIIEDAICGDGGSYGCLDERIKAIAPDLVARCRALAGEDE